MKKHLEVNGDKIRREREKRAWTQEDLSEKTQLGVRTLRRLEAGYASLETIKRVNQALALEPEVALPKEPSLPDRCRDSLHHDTLMVEIAPDLNDLAGPLIERIVSVRRHIARTLGFLLPGVRLRDNPELPPHGYRILIREVAVASRALRPGKVLALTRDLEGEPTLDPTYAVEATWIDPQLRPQAQSAGIHVFDSVSLIATHLTERVRAHAGRLLGIEDVQVLLEQLRHPHLIAAVIPHKLSLIGLRSVLRSLLQEQISIRDLVLILETLADHATPDRPAEELCEIVRQALAPWICQEYANRDQKIVAITLDPQLEKTLEASGCVEDIRQPLNQAFEQVAGQPLLVTSAALRPKIRQLFPGRSGLVVLSRQEITPHYQIQSHYQVTSPNTHP